MADDARLDKVSIGLNVGFFKMESEWVPDARERSAAWELYVELVTRVATQPLDPDHGLCREALASLYSLFATTRAILRAGGPALGVEQRSVGYLALSVLNRGIRPFLSRWHPRLLEHEARRPPTLNAVAHERSWQHDLELRGELEALRVRLWTYAGALAEIAGIRRRAG